MKKTIVLAAALLIAAGASAQEKNFLDKPYIEVTGKADMEVTPDEIYVRIVINEKDNKGKVSVEHLVEQSRNMEAEGRFPRRLVLRGDLLGRQPAPVAESEFQFVAVEQRLPRAPDRADLGQLDSSYAFQLLGDLLLLEAELFVVRHVLPLASAADAEMLADRLDAQRRAADETDDTALHVSPAFAAHLYVDHVARHGHRNEHDDVVPSPERLALGGYGDDFERLDQRMIRFFSSHLFSRFVFYHSN